MNERIEAIIQERQKQGLSIQQLADMCRLSASTVSRTLSGKTDPSDFTIHAMEEALGITDKQTGEPIDAHIGNDPILQRYLNMQESRILRLRAHYNMLIAEKNRWIMMLFLLSLSLVVIVIAILAIDVINPNAGWLR